LVRRLPIAILLTSFRIKRSKVKVTKPTNYETESVSYLPKFNLGTQMEWKRKDADDGEAYVTAVEAVTLSPVSTTRVDGPS